jgi:hypothetical protein
MPFSGLLPQEERRRPPRVGSFSNSVRKTGHQAEPSANICSAESGFIVDSKTERFILSQVAA